MARLTAEGLETIGRGLDAVLNGKDCPKEERTLGFALVVFPFGGPAISQYISSAKREEMIAALRETADRLERGEDKPRN